MTFINLKWDTEYFGIPCAKVILSRSLLHNEWIEVKENFKTYKFITIENRDSDPCNAQLIGSDTTAFLVDVNIQFRKIPEAAYSNSESVVIYQAMTSDPQILDIADFTFSRFIVDPKLAQMNGADVYRHWVINAFGKADKYFAIYKDTAVEGFVLHSFNNGVCTIELIAVSPNSSMKGIGTTLFREVENSACQKGISEIKVGTQIRNIPAINFYHKLGCKMVGCHQIYHLWND